MSMLQRMGRWIRRAANRPPRAEPCRRTVAVLRLELLEERDLLAAGILRIASYNITSAGGAPRPGLATILQALGDEATYGRSQPPDLVALQEVQRQTTTTASVVSLLNSIHGAGTYARGSRDGATTGAGTQGVVYNTRTLQLISETVVGTATVTTGQARQALRYHFHPIGFGPEADFYAYDSHYRANTGTTPVAGRLVEAQAIRASADALGQGAQVLYLGDLNTYTSTESGYQHLLSAGPGQAFDPISRPGSWHSSASFAGIFTQAPAVAPPSPLTGGGLDDRFDFQLITGELADGMGLEIIPGSYHAFGNNGSVPVNANINDLRSTALPGLSNRREVLDLLTTVSDHLPVVADYYVVGSVQFSAPSFGVSETSPAVTITVMHTGGGNPGTVTVRYATGSGTATPGADFTASTGSLSLAPGETSKTFTIPILDDALSEGTETITLTLSTPTGAVLGAQSSAALAIVDNEAGPGGRIADDGDLGFGMVGPGWVSLLVPGFQIDAQFAAAGSGDHRAAWTFPGLAPGQYRVWATWFPHPLLATNAPFLIKDGATTLAAVPVNQELAPAGLSEAGSDWRDLGTFTISGTLTVELSNLADEFVEADAIRVERVGHPLRIVDSGDSGFSAGAAWQPLLIPGAFQWDLHVCAPGGGAGPATWTFTGLESGLYRVSATWIAHPSLAGDARFTVSAGGTPLGIVTVNQQASPTGFSDAGAVWDDLGFFAISGDGLAVTLSDLANGFLLADAIRIERVV